MVVVAIVVSVFIVGIVCSVVLCVIGFLMVIVAIHGGLYHGRLSGNWLEALGGANPSGMGWWRWNEGREKEVWQIAFVWHI